MAVLTTANDSPDDAAYEAARLKLRAVCMWCLFVMREGEPGQPTTHGICPKCAGKFFNERKHGVTDIEVRR